MAVGLSFDWMDMQTLMARLTAVSSFERSLAAKYNQIGDAVPPSISAKIAQHIIQLKLNQNPSQDSLQFTPLIARQLNLFEA